MMVMDNMTPTQQRIMDVLSDGYAHKRADLLACIDELAEPSALRQHIRRMRKVLRPRGEDIVCVLTGTIGLGYRWIRIVGYEE